ncbi:hypothetical protein KX729_29415 [Rhizobium sp. XQZ8]|uniref:hypothetical protein n=1 Tax=Rhizobium populisoli TaxID=2859785 RepID=UPI001CA5926F|nr:hypothetical protein [Rhizobium populisoli]MBW6425535.1 hypothetical protein [Rhizobium populisoli]
MRNIVILPAIAVMLAACGTVSENSDVGLVHVAGRQTVQDDTAVVVTETGPRLSNEKQRVIGSSCMNKMWDPPPSKDNAINLMKRQAASRGFNAVHSVTVVNDPAAAAKNCWSALIASGIAYRQ